MIEAAAIAGSIAFVVTFTALTARDIYIRNRKENKK